MAQPQTYLFFDGNCAEAMQFYTRALGGKNFFSMTAGQAPDPSQFPATMRDKVLHARFEVEGHAILASDWMDASPYPGMKGFAVSLSYQTAEEAKRVFEQLAEGGQAPMPFGETFFAKGFGMVTDRFGTPWMVMGAQK